MCGPHRCIVRLEEYYTRKMDYIHSITSCLVFFLETANFIHDGSVQGATTKTRSHKTKIQKAPK